MYRVLVSTSGPELHFIRQSPGKSAIWEDFEFVFNQSDVDCDAWIVYESLAAATRANCPPQNVTFISAEPPTLRTYGGDFLRQFRWVVSCHDVKHRGLIAQQQAIPWHAGVEFEGGCRASLDYDALTAMPKPEKSRVLSVVISNKAITPGHRQRLEFVNKLKAQLGDALDVYGNGHRPIADKWDALAPYRFHLALENTARPHYLSEKVCDAFLGFCYPFYFGAPNAPEYLPEDSYTAIDVFQPDQAVELVCDGIEQGLDKLRQPQIAAARTTVLNELNFFPMAVAFLRQRMSDSSRKPVRLYPKNQHVQLALRSVRKMVGVHS